jgi:hypothetical protein
MSELNIPTKEFYEREPGAAEIRRLALLGIGANIARLNGDKSDATLGELMGANMGLRQWGVVEKIHGADENMSEEDMTAHQVRIASSPRLAAEYVAGQFLDHLRLAETLDSLQGAVLDEHDVFSRDQRATDDGELRMLDMESASPVVREYSAQIGVLGVLRTMLDDNEARPRDESLARGEPYRHPLLHDD